MTIAAPQPKANMGDPIPRMDGRMKVTGEARYASDFPVGNPAYAVLVTSPIAKGHIKAFDLKDAQSVPGVLEILTHENTANDVKPSKFVNDGGRMSSSVRPLSSPQIWHDGQIIAVVVADSLEAAQEAAYRVRADFQSEPATATLNSPGVEVQAAVDAPQRRHKEDPHIGNAEDALSKAEVKIDVEYWTPTQHHNPMELFATTCAWTDDKLTIFEPSQFVWGLKYAVSEQLGIDPDRIEVKNPFVGGAFGSKGTATQRTALVAIAAKKINRPVKLVVTRAQGFTTATYRAETRHRIRLGAGRDGKITAFTHEGWELTSRPDAYLVAGTRTTTRMYAWPNVASKVYIVRADRNTPGFMRSPPEVPYIFALETAMDELAVALRMDPIDVRRANDTMTDPITGVPYTSRSLLRCFEEASSAFGWSKRNPEAASMRDGDWMVGFGCAMACYPSQMAPAAARVRLNRQGKVQVAIAAHEIGTGAQTVIGQMAARRLGVAPEAVTVMLGDSDLPPGPIAGGSNTTASACNAIIVTCDKIRDRLFKNAVTANDGALAGQDAARLELAGNRIVNPTGVAESLSKVFDRLGAGVIEEYGEWVPKGEGAEGLAALYSGSSRIIGGPMKDRISYAFGAEFVEVRVNARTHEIRVPRIVGAFAAGHIMNTRTARSQYLGGMIWGIGSALHEATEIDQRNARYVNTNFADYLVPVNADVDRVEIIMVPEEDKEVNPAGIKGIGELANVGTAAAISNAVYHATGKRIRKLPIRIEDLIVKA